MSLTLGELGPKMERASHASAGESATVINSVQVELGLEDRIILTNPALGRFLSLLKRNLAPHIITHEDLEDEIRFDYLIYTGWNNDRLAFLNLLEDVPEVGEGVWIDENVITMFNALSDIVETLPYIRTYRENSQRILSHAFRALLMVLRSGDIASGSSNFCELTARTQSSVDLFMTEANQDALKILRNRIVSHESVDGKVSIVPKLIE